MKQTISIIGAGNVATHLGNAFFKKGFNIHQIFSQHIENATLLAQEVNATAIKTVGELDDTADFYLICIKDIAINQVLKSIRFKNQLIAHTSGSIDMNAFKENGFEQYGIIYPLQTFSREHEVNISEVPFCIEGNNNQSQNCLFELAQQLSNNVSVIDSEQRKILHLAAVFACNFTNYMYSIANEIANENNIDFDILKPLILETAKKIQHNSPKSMQTGPAIRKDAEVIKNHLQMLMNSKDYQTIYQLITDSIH